jgi:hypothetical protein
MKILGGKMEGNYVRMSEELLKADKGFPLYKWKVDTANKRISAQTFLLCVNRNPYL